MATLSLIQDFYVQESLAELRPLSLYGSDPPHHKPQILIYYPDFGAFGGIERHIMDVVDALLEEGHYEPIVVCHQGTPFFKALQQRPVELYGIQTFSIFSRPILRFLDLPSHLHLLWLLEHIQPELVHLHIGSIENLLFKMMGYPVIYTFHGYGEAFSLQNTRSVFKRFIKKAFQWVFRLMAKQMDAMIFVSQAEEKRMRREGYLPPQVKTQVIYNGIAMGDFQEQLRLAKPHQLKHKLGIPHEALCVSFINRLDHNKDPHAFIELAERLPTAESLQPIHFLMVGSGPLMESVQARIQMSPLSDRFHLLGHRSDIPSILAASDLIISPAKMEGFGLGILEAMASGTCCLCYRTGGLTEIIPKDLAETLTASVGDFEALYQRAANILSLSEIEHHRISLRLRSNALRFDLKTMMEHLNRVYHRILKPSPGNQLETSKPFHPEISIILPVYQGESMISGAVQSVLNQTYPHWELIIVDDGSTDGTSEQLKTLTDPRIKVLRQENQGVATARNLGMSQGKGEYFAFLDADDRWFPQKLATEMETLEKYAEPECLIYSGYYAVDELDQLIKLSEAYTDQGYILEAVLENEGLLLPSTTLMHRRIYDELGGFSADCYHEDRVYFIKACQRFPAYPTEQRLVIYRQSLAGRCRSILTDYDAAFEAEFSIIQALEGTLPQTDLERLSRLQGRNLLYRFLMYNFTGSARKLAETFGPEIVSKDKKGILATVSLRFGVNILYGARLGVQAFSKAFLMFWWRWKMASVANSI